MPEIMDVIRPLLVDLLLVVLTGAIGFVGTYVTQFIKSKLNSNQLALLEDIAADVVLAVEQSTYGTNLKEHADAKKHMAIDLMNQFLKKYSISLTEEQIDAAIETAVANVLNANKLIEPSVVVENVEGPVFNA